MPYIEAVALESLRMFIARAFGVPHRSIKDTTLGGYFIPKVIITLFKNIQNLDILMEISLK